VTDVPARENRFGRHLLVLGLLLPVTGCATSRPDGDPAAAASSAAVSSAATSSAATSPDDDDAADAPETPGGPPAKAQMVCSDEIQRTVTGALALDSLPAPTSTWADDVFTCSYLLPMGTLQLSVVVAADNASAHAALGTLRTQFGADDPEAGFGEEAWSASDGTVLAVKDNMVLHVDATALPDDLGLVHERRIDFAEIMAAAVFGCWTENS
jgi:hypothetical protein